MVHYYAERDKENKIFRAESESAAISIAEEWIVNLGGDGAGTLRELPHTMQSNLPFADAIMRSRFICNIGE